MNYKHTKYHITYYYCSITAPRLTSSVIMLKSPIDTEVGIEEAYSSLRRIIIGSGSQAEPTIISYIELR